MSTSKTKYLINKLALILFKGLSLLGRGLAGLWSVLRPVFAVIFSVLLRFLLLPIYKVLVIVRLRLSKLLMSARGFFFLILTNRYVFHGVILAISLPVIGSQLQAKTATAMDVGQHSILYAMVTSDSDAVIEETAQPETVATKNSHYLGSETIQALPGIDYDYDTINQPTADLNIPGSISLRPNEPGMPTNGETSGTAIATTSEDTSVTYRTGTETYTIQDGDTLAAIAHRYGVNVGTILWANNLTERTVLKIGQSLKIPAVSGVLHTVVRGETISSLAKKFNVDAAEIASANNLDASGALALGQELVIPGATPPETVARPIAVAKPSTATTAKTVAVAKDSVVRPDIPLSRISNKALDIYQELVKAPTDNRAKPADVATPAATAPQTKLLWPTRLHIINQYYGWAHTGVDFDGDYTDPIYAAEDGVVTTAGWNNGGYGLYIVIDHGNGLTTRYGHASKIFVNAGDTVKRGEVIAMVGTTGRSTGTHLHFEVLKNGKRQNPLTYVK